MKSRLEEAVKGAVKEVRTSEARRPIRIVGHLDADGICAASILVKALLRIRRKHALSIVPQLDDSVIAEIEKDPPSLVIFVDIGSGQFTLLHERLRKTRFIVLDHHEVDDDTESSNATHINPHLLGSKDSKFISGAGLAYLFARTLDPKNKDLAHLAVVGALADAQDQPAFSKINQEILEDAKQQGLVNVTYGLRLYGRTTRPLHKVLEFSSDHQIPGVSGSENGALAFLSSVGIDPRRDGSWRTLSSLSDDEHKRLVAGILLKRARIKNPDSILGHVYSIEGEPKDTPLCDAREFATLLNACGRLSKSSLGVGACIGDSKMKKRAVDQLGEYRRHLNDAMRWYQAQRNDVIKGKGFIIINAHDNVLPTMIGTICSIIARSGEVPQNTVIIGIARLSATQSKVSFRAAGRGIDLCKLASRLASKVDGSAGGHKEAAGAIIAASDEQTFIDFARSKLGK